MTLSSALIQCYFDYSCSSWYSSLSKHLKQTLQVCQNKMVRFILNLGPRHSINCDILDSLNMLNVEARVKQLRLNHVFNIVQGLAPNYLQENFTLVSSTCRYATRSSSNRNFIVPPNIYIWSRNILLFRYKRLEWSTRQYKGNYKQKYF